MTLTYKGVRTMTKATFIIARSIAAVASVIAAFAATSASATVFTDPGTFSTATWSKTILGGGDVVDTRETSGGNAGDWLQLQTIPNGDNGADIVVGVFLDSAATWNPSTQGAIDYMTMYIDKKLIATQIAHSQGQAIRIALLQGGKSSTIPSPRRARRATGPTPAMGPPPW